MHELPIVEHILKKSLNYAKRHKAKRVLSIHLSIGELSGFVDESIEFYWQIVSQGTIAGNARVVVKRQESYLICHNCQEKIPVKNHPGICPHCSSIKLTIDDENKLDVDFIEIE